MTENTGQISGKAYPLSQCQLNIWSLEKTFHGTPINNICETIRIRGRFDITILQKTLELIVSSDSTLRTRIFRDGDTLLQYEAEYIPERFPVFDFSKSDEAGLHHWEHAIAKEVMPVEGAPLYYFAIFKLGEHEGGVLLKCHHLISDGWSQVLLINKLADIYLRLLAGETVELQTAPSYLLHVESEADYRNSRHYQADRTYWQELLAEPAYPAALRENSAVVVSPVGQRLGFEFSRRLNHAIYSYCSDQRVAPFAVYYMALALYIKRTVGVDRFCLGVPIYNRINISDRETSGMFVSTLPFISRIDEAWSFNRFSEEVMINWYDLLRHQSLPYEEIMDIAVKCGQESRQLSHMAFSFQSSRIYSNKEASVTFSGEWHYSGYQAEQLCIHLNNMEEDNLFRVNYDYLTQIFSEKEIADLHKHLTTILSRALADPDKPLKEISMADEADEEKVVYAFNSTAVRCPDKSVYTRLSEIKDKYTKRAAVIDEGRRYSYTALLERADDYARALEAATPRIEAGEVVAVLLPKSFELMAAICGIAQSGRAWLLLDAGQPLRRIEEILQDSKAKVLIGSGPLIEQYGLRKKTMAVLLPEKMNPRDKNADFLPSLATLNDPAYLIYTSGSTGKPKAVEIGGRSLINFAMCMKKYYAAGAVLSLNNVGFDAFLIESMAALLNGNTVVLPPAGAEENPAVLAAHILDYGVGFITMTPGRLAAYFNDAHFRRACARLESIVCGGEAFPPSLLRQLSLFTSARIYNQYGPSETTVGVTIKLLNGAATITAGKPMANCRIYVLDSQLKPLPVGVGGDIYIGGLCVGRGYRNQPELTDAAFLASPFEPDELIYRSGDIGYWSEDGELNLQGRKDNQIKLRGLRIELDEIASRLSLHPEVEQAAALVFKSHDQPLIAAYYVSASPVAERELLELAATYLPYYMVPALFIHVTSLPLTANGKLDTVRLPQPVWQDDEESSAADPATEKVLAIFREVLQNPELSLNSDYFANGGTSLNAMETLSRLEEAFGTRLRVADLYSCRRASRLARLLGGDVGYASAPSITKAPQLSGYPLSPIQQSLYFQTMLTPDGTGYNMPGALILPDDANIDRLEAAFGKLIADEAVFRTGFVFTGGKLVQRIEEKAHFELEHILAPDLDTAAATFIRPFDLSRAPLLRAALWEDDNQRVLLVDMHHIIGDGLSMPLVMARLNAAYAMQAPAEVELTYIDYAYWQSQENVNKAGDIAYWQEVLADLPEPLDIPTDFPRPVNFDFQGQKYRFDLDKALSDRLKAYCATQGLTPAMLFAGAFAIMLSRFSHSEDIIVGMPVSARNSAELSNIIGPFINTQPLRLKPKEAMRPGAFFESVRDRVLGAIDHQQLSLEELLNLCGAPRQADRNPLYQTLFSYRPVRDEVFRLGESPMQAVPLENHSAKMELSLEAFEAKESFGFIFEYATSLFSEETVAFYSRVYEKILQSIIVDEQVLLGELDSLPEEDRFELLERPNYLHSPFLDLPLDIQFSRMARLYPQREAIVCRGESMSYYDLEKRAIAIAGQLQANGVKAGNRIALMIRRNSDMLAALLAINKAGCAYVPVSKSFPESRISYILENAEAVLILGDSESLAVLPETLPCPKLPISNQDYPFVLPQNRSGDDLIHILYTSGSTGKPKGVAIKHRALSNLLGALTPYLNGSSGNVLCSSNIIFDVFITESLISLAIGKTVVLADDEEMMLPWKLAALIENYGATILQMTPSRLQVCLGNTAFSTALGKAEILILAGETLNRELIQMVKATGAVRIINLYGPCEAAVYVSGGEINDAVRPHIGKPLDNCRIYLLDAQQRQVLPASWGELYLAGICLAEGYCGDPERTADVFVPDPFFPGQKMYKTGDIGRLLTDGNIEFLGRRDNQVKINGQRVELDEINGAILSSGLIRETATIVTQSAQSGVRLHAFVVAHNSESPDLAALRRYMKELLPDYMMPSEIIPIAELPRTESGKTDILRLKSSISGDIINSASGTNRHNEVPSDPTAPVSTSSEPTLIINANPQTQTAYDGTPSAQFQPPGKTQDQSTVSIVSDFNTPDRSGLPSNAKKDKSNPVPFPVTCRTDAAAATGTADGLLALWQTVLDKEDIDPDKSFFEQGGSSLAALNLLGLCFNQGMMMTLAQFYEHPTLRAQRELLSLRVDNKKVSGSDKEILLTGATGFFGVHLLKELCESGEKAICLVRGNSKKIFNLLEQYFGTQWLQQYRMFITPVNGDVTLPEFGLNEDLTKKVKAVYHAAADVRHYAMDNNHYLVNQVGTAHAIDFAKRANAVLHHISTISVSGEYLLADPARHVLFTERDREIGQNWRDNIYVRYKFEAENLVYQAMEAGLNAHIYRLGRLGCRQSDGRFQMNPDGTSYWEILQGIQCLDMLPVDLGDLKIELTPVDEAARAVWLLRDSCETCFHVFNDQLITLRELAFTLKGYYPTDARKEEFELYLGQRLREDSRLAAITEYYTRIIIQHPYIEPRADMTVARLEERDFAWQHPSTIDYSWLFPETLSERRGLS